MTWKVVNATAIGVSHNAQGGECQDECYTNLILSKQEDECVLGIISDGAGSATNGKEGAQIVCEGLAQIIENWFCSGNEIGGIEKQDILDWIERIRELITTTANISNLEKRDYAATLLCALIGLNNAIFFQIGDGAIIIESDLSLKTVFWPDNEEYPNCTHFITEEFISDHLRILKLDYSPLEFALFSDGLQRLALTFSDQSVFTPFFQPMLEVIRFSDQNKCDLLSDKLRQFLISKAVNERTDDDKSLILGSRIVLSKELVCCQQ